MKNIGFTGTRQEISTEQSHTLKRVLHYLRHENVLMPDSPKELIFHHGDCLGADKAAHYLAEACGYVVHVHPPNNERLRAHCKPKSPGIILPCASYHQRNLDIVWESQIVVACPNEMNEIIRSGTWSTVRLARKHSRRRILVYPDGSIGKEGFFDTFQGLT